VTRDGVETKVCGLSIKYLHLLCLHMLRFMRFALTASIFSRAAIPSRRSQLLARHTLTSTTSRRAARDRRHTLLFGFAYACPMFCVSVANRAG